MNRRSFMSAVAALAAVIPAVAVSAKASEQFGQRITVENPPEPGFEYMGSKRYKVFCDGMEVEHCIRADVPGGKAWTRHMVRLYPSGGPFVAEEREYHGHIRLERIA